MGYSNGQQLKFLQGLLTTESKQVETIDVHVRDKHDGIPMYFEVSNNTDGDFLAWRIHTSTGNGLWQTWEEPEAIEMTFKTMSLI